MSIISLQLNETNSVSLLSCIRVLHKIPCRCAFFQVKMQAASALCIVFPIKSIFRLNGSSHCTTERTQKSSRVEQQHMKNILAVRGSGCNLEVQMKPTRKKRCAFCRKSVKSSHRLRLCAGDERRKVFHSLNIR